MSAGDNLPAGAGSEQLPMPGAEYPSSADDATSVEGLDAQLDEALGDFDETVMGQGSGSNEDSIDILNPRGGGSSGMASDEPLFEEGDPGNGGDPVENDELAQRAAEGASGGGGANAETDGQQVGGSSAQGGEAGIEEIVPIPDDIGDGRSDDIVLRQVRDAAMKESDPVLREKLWDEYRRIRDQK
jgi:hypothetical protein